MGVIAMKGKRGEGPMGKGMRKVPEPSPRASTRIIITTVSPSDTTTLPRITKKDNYIRDVYRIRYCKVPYKFPQGCLLLQLGQPYIHNGAHRNGHCLSRYRGILRRRARLLCFCAVHVSLCSSRTSLQTRVKYVSVVTEKSEGAARTIVRGTRP